MTTTVDARGLSCPQPVMLAIEAITAGEFPVEVLVDTATARENIARMVRSKGLQVEVAELGDEFKLILSK